VDNIRSKSKTPLHPPSEDEERESVTIELLRTTDTDSTLTSSIDVATTTFYATSVAPPAGDDTATEINDDSNSRSTSVFPLFLPHELFPTGSSSTRSSRLRERSRSSDRVRRATSRFSREEESSFTRSENRRSHAFKHPFRSTNSDNSFERTTKDSKWFRIFNFEIRFSSSLYLESQL